MVTQAKHTLILSRDDADNLLTLLDTAIATLNNGNWGGRNKEWIESALALRVKINDAPIEYVKGE